MRIVLKLYVHQGMIFFIAILMSSSIHAAICSPSAVIEGEPWIVNSLFATPSLSDVSPDAKAGCPAVWVVVTEQTIGFRVQIEDHLDRRYEQTVKDIDTAAALIDSWARGDALISVLPGREPIVSPKKEASRPSDNSGPQKTKASKSDSQPTPPSRSVDIIVGAAFEYTMGADESSWFGGQAHFCTTIGMICIGGLLRGLVDPTITGRYREVTDLRSGMDVLLIAAIPIELRRVRLRPLIALGAGWIQTSRSIAADESLNREISFGGIRFELGASVSVRLVRQLYMDFGGGLTTSFIAEADKVTMDGVTFGGEPRHYLRLLVGFSRRWS